MKDYYKILGVSKTASSEEIKQAYRKAAGIHHPDKKGGDEEKFKEIKEAYDWLSDPKKRSEHDNPRSANVEDDFMSMEEIIRRMREIHGVAGFSAGHEDAYQQIFEVVTDVPMAEAYRGFNMKIRLNNKDDEIQVPRGVPNYSRGQYTSKNGQKIIVTVRFIPGPYTTKTINSVSQVVDASGTKLTGEIDSGLVDYTLNVDALDLLLGAWVDVMDFTGEVCKMRIPAGHDPNQRLRLKGKGYVNWNLQRGEASTERSDMYVRLNPIFKQPKDLDKAKVKQLYDASTFVSGTA